MARSRLSRALVWTAGAVSVLVLAAACGGGGGASSTENGLETDTVSIGLGKDPGLAPQMVAIKKGFLKDEGFTKVESSTYDAGALAGQALAAGEIDLWGPSNLPVISMRHNGTPVVVAATAVSGWSEKLVVRDDADVETPEDLTKIKIGYLAGASDNILYNLAKANDLDPASLKKVNLPPADQLTALANNDVQAIVVWNPWPALFKEQHPDIPVTYLWEQNTSHFPWAADEPMKASYSRMLFVLKEDYIKTKPKAAAAVMDAMFKAQEWLSDPANKAEAQKIFEEYTGYSASVVQSIWDDYKFQPDLDQSYIDDMTSYTDFLSETGAIKGKQDPMSYTYTGFLKSFRPEAVTVSGGWKP